MDLDIDIQEDDVPMFDPYNEAEVYAWHRDAEARYRESARVREPHGREGNGREDDNWEEEEWEEEEWEEEEWEEEPAMDRVNNRVDFGARPRLGKSFDMRGNAGTPDSDDDTPKRPDAPPPQAVASQLRRDKMMEQLAIEEAEEEQRHLASKMKGQSRTEREEEHRRPHNIQLESRREGSGREGDTLRRKSDMDHRLRHEQKEKEEERRRKTRWKRFQGRRRP